MILHAQLLGWLVFSCGSVAAAQPPAVAVGHSCGQLTYQFQGRHYTYAHHDDFLLREALKPVRASSPRAVFLWGQNAGLRLPALEQGLRKGIEASGLKTAGPILIGALYLSRIAVSPVLFAPCNDALDFTALGGSGVSVRAAAAAEVTGALGDAAARLVQSLKPWLQDKLLLVLISEKAAGDGSLAGLAESLRRAAGPGPVILAMVGGQPFHQSQAFAKGLAAAMIAGPLEVRVRSVHPYEPMSKPMRVTRQDGPLVMELDGQPLLDVFARTIQASRDGLARRALLRRFPLGVRDGAGWQPVVTLAAVDRGGVTTIPALGKDAEVVIMQTGDSQMSGLVERLASAADASPAGQPVWQLTVSNSLYWDGWAKSQAEYDAMKKAAGPDAAATLLYPRDALVLEPEGRQWRGLFHVVSVALEQGKR